MFGSMVGRPLSIEFLVSDGVVLHRSVVLAENRGQTKIGIKGIGVDVTFEEVHPDCDAVSTEFVLPSSSDRNFQLGRSMRIRVFNDKVTLARAARANSDRRCDGRLTI